MTGDKICVSLNLGREEGDEVYGNVEGNEEESDPADVDDAHLLRANVGHHPAVEHFQKENMLDDVFLQGGSE